MQPRDAQILADIVDSGRLIDRYCRDLTFDVFLDTPETQDAVLRRLEIIGEAARRLSAGARSMLGDMPWSGWIGLRNIIAHQYESVDLYAIWETVNTEVPELVRRVEAALRRS